MPESLRAMLKNGRGLLWDPDEVHALFESRDENLRHLDPKLAREGYDFGRALSGLFDAAEVGPGNAKEEVGLIFAWRKDKKLRLIADTRAANVHSSDPTFAELASPEPLVVIEHHWLDAVGFCPGDVEVRFFQYGMP